LNNRPLLTCDLQALLHRQLKKKKAVAMGKGGKGGGASGLVMVFSFLFFIIAFGLAVGAETRRSQVYTPSSVASCHTLVYLYISV
jgi:preprotein translocase subunit SecG